MEDERKKIAGGQMLKADQEKENKHKSGELQTKKKMLDMF